jgi:hypothetical protein
MKIISFIEEEQLVKKILKHLTYGMSDANRLRAPTARRLNPLFTIQALTLLIIIDWRVDELPS